MVKGYNRAERVGDLIQVALSEIIQRESEEMQIGIVTITGVHVAHDMSYAKVFVSVLLDTQAKEVIKALNEEAKYFRFQLAKAVKLRSIPQLKFIYDDSTVRGARISSLLNSSLNKK